MHRPRLCILVALSSVALGGATEAAARPSVLDLAADAKVRVLGAAPSDVAGHAVAAAGDVNGDGRLPNRWRHQGGDRGLFGQWGGRRQR
jgi:hypothetical protein